MSSKSFAASLAGPSLLTILDLNVFYAWPLLHRCLFNMQDVCFFLKSESLTHSTNSKDFCFDGDPRRTSPCSSVDSSFITLSSLVPLFTATQTPESSHALAVFHPHLKGQPQRPSPIKNSGKHLNLAVYPDLNLPLGRSSLITSLGAPLLGQSFLRNVPSVTLMA